MILVAPRCHDVKKCYTLLVGTSLRNRHEGGTTFEPRKKKPYYFPLYWLVYRDPYNGLL